MSESSLDGMWSVKRQQRAVEGLTMMDVLSLPEADRQLVNWLLRQTTGATFDDVAGQMGWTEDQARSQLPRLVGEGLVQRSEENGQQLYRARLTTKQNRRVSNDIWQALDSDEQKEQSGQGG